MTEDALRQRCEKLAERIRRAHPSFEGHPVRVDAGEAGMIYVAIRDAKRQPTLGERLCVKLEEILDDAIADAPEDLDFAISLGSGNHDLLLQVEVRHV